MRIDQINGNFTSIGGIQQQQQKQLEAGGKVKQDNFANMLADAVGEVNALQLEADNKIESMILGKGNVLPHDAMIALEKADVAFQLMNAVRGKIIQAYEQIIRTQV